MFAKNRDKKLNINNSKPKQNSHFSGRSKKLSQCGYSSITRQGIFQSEDKSLWRAEHNPYILFQIILAKRLSKVKKPDLTRSKEIRDKILLEYFAYRPMNQGYRDNPFLKQSQKYSNIGLAAGYCPPINQNSHGWRAVARR